MFLDIFLLCVSLFLVIKGAIISTKYAVKLASSLGFSKYLVGFIVVAVISILPETFISINSSLEGMPAFGLGTLFGSNVADLTLVFAIIIALSGKNIKVESKILKNNVIYPFLLLIPLLLGLDGYYSRPEGAILVAAGTFFYYFVSKNSTPKQNKTKPKHRLKYFLILLFSLTLLLTGAHFTVLSATNLATLIGISPILIGMLIVGLGTTIPELLFSLQSIKQHNDSLAIGDLLGTVLADATVVVGILALITPFAFPQKIVYVTGAFMLAAAFILSYFMRTGKKISKRESFILFLFWLIFILTEYFLSK